MNYEDIYEDTLKVINNSNLKKADNRGYHGVLISSERISLFFSDYVLIVTKSELKILNRVDKQQLYKNLEADEFYYYLEQVIEFIKMQIKQNEIIQSIRNKTDKEIGFRNYKIDKLFF